ncbi:Phosphatidylinositide phosphatase SAC1 [Geranomyces variabilis]|uniref:Phosphatidylinositide phosphatase SAC1 n=1 Tax=Geranomyces variabilis TaxID=109894 RepID=A0AAD5TUM7_9FUNG|nr:Phosphatidylinositide phosphatase SAC1 [Geranomyces variabilis]
MPPSASDMVARDSFRLYRSSEARPSYVLESPLQPKKASTAGPPSMLVVSPDGVVGVKTLAQVAALGIDDSSHVDVCGIVGIIDLILGKYLIVATARTLAATLQSHKIWRITAASILPLGAADQNELAVKKATDLQTLAKHTLDQELLQSINEIANSGHLYYSTTYDITHSVQHNFLKASRKATKTVIDDRFFFTKALAQPFINAGDAASPWVLHIMCGFAGTIDLNVDLPAEQSGLTKPYKLTLLSRLNRRRVGTRYVRRGLDFEGNTANNVEMEQIVYHEDYHRCKKISAFVQIRGSVPSVWGQDLSLAYKPDLLVPSIDKSAVWNSCQKHYDDLKHQYIGEPQVAPVADIGKVVCVNLLDVTGFEGRLSKVYDASVKRFRDEKVSYEEFPINKWCKGGNFRNMDILLDRVRDRLVNSGWLVGDGDVPASTPSKTPLTVSKLQTGLARVSCLDSLDRTNLTCSIFARYMLPYQLQTITAELQPVPASANGVIASDLKDPVAPMRAALQQVHLRSITNMWADSGDAVSLLYAGTGALKADVTRTGRKTLRGSLTDGINSLTRYYLNNFVDGRRQDAYDLWTGKAVASQIQHLVATEGVRRAQRVQAPYIASGSGILGRVVPQFVIDTVEPLLQTATEYVRARPRGNIAAPATHLSQTPDGEIHTTTTTKWVSPHFDTEGSPNSVPGLLVSVAKLYAPTQITGVIQFAIALVLSVYLLVLVRILGIQGQFVVNRPRLSVEYRNIFELLD